MRIAFALFIGFIAGLFAYGSLMDLDKFASKWTADRKAESVEAVKALDERCGQGMVAIEGARSRLVCISGTRLHNE